MKKRTKIIAAICIAVIAATGIATGWYANDYYRAVAVSGYMTDTESVTVSAVDEGCFFDGPGEENALIFYPGGKVEETAYAPLMQALAAAGTDCFLVKMPMKLAVFGMNKADSIVAQYTYENYYLAGHSLGGAMAANYAAKHPHDFAGLFLLAAYPSEDLSAVSFPVVFIYGENDRVLNRKKLQAGMALAPADSQTVVINGGNHAGFGAYGNQKGDGTATISAAAQQQMTADAVLSVIQH